MAALGAVMAALVAAGFAIRHLRRPEPAEGGWRKHLAFNRANLRVFGIGIGLSGLVFLQDVLRSRLDVLAPFRLALVKVLDSLAPEERTRLIPKTARQALHNYRHWGDMPSGGSE